MSLYSQSGAIPAHVRVIAVTPWIALMVQLLIKVLSFLIATYMHTLAVTLHDGWLAGWVEEPGPNL